jgi:restriction system protein
MKAFPDYQTIMLPLLKFARDNQEHSLREAIDTLADEFDLSHEERKDTKIILIDGQRMAELMIDHNVGVSPLASYEIKKIDTDYFIEE